MPDEAEKAAHYAELKKETIEKLDWKIWDVVDAVRACLDRRLWEPALILLYSSIDALAWLGCPPEQSDSTRADFVAWVSRYMLPLPGVECSADDLYAARCGLLHTRADSRLNRTKRARRLYYHRRFGEKVLGVIQVRMKDSIMPLSIDIDVMLTAYEQGVVKFGRALAANPDQYVAVVTRVITSYMAEVEWHGEPLQPTVDATVIRR